ncbi:MULTISPECIES: transglutaminase family protein [unclassified Frigoribacterium]|uniref:transglutaminase family protein n=1 Tax=unclassified Frigoribacterium TaxID=2627005 RepID=UPI0006FC6BFB|nr:MULTISPECIES: transglutaminase family protein [unclassified Frigoribacterium]KQO84516.1 transglutaminase [Frigoribacterium sp. Leaf263]KQR63838.1 transglutaminase [Frigoribacterium sp. Leaf172]
MSRLRIRHRTGFSYRGEAVASYNEARMLPAHTEGQFVLSSHLRIEPVAATHEYIDYWGTRVSSFEVLLPHRELSLTATSLVEVRPLEHPDSEMDWTELAAVAGATTEFVEHLEQTPLTRPPAELVALARETAAKASSPRAAGLAICEQLGDAVAYLPGVTNVKTTASEAWEARAGVCQDIAHITVGALRAVGIPARYVSGYLHPKPAAELRETVTGESHAWVEYYCGSWRGYDPTNLIDIGERHVIVGQGRDYRDVPPLRGVYAGSSNSTLFVTVEITREA